MSGYGRNNNWGSVARATFALACLCLIAAVITVDGWMVAQRLLAIAGVLGLVALVAMLGATS